MTGINTKLDYKKEQTDQMEYQMSFMTFQRRKVCTLFTVKAENLASGLSNFVLIFSYSQSCILDTRERIASTFFQLFEK